MKKLSFITLIFLLVISCSATLKTVDIFVDNENQIFVQGEKIELSEFQDTIKRLTKGMNTDQIKELTFSLNISAQTRLGIVSDLKSEYEKWDEYKLSLK